MKEKRRSRLLQGALFTAALIAVGVGGKRALSRSRASNSSGVVLWDKTAAATGINVIEELNSNCALVAMDGTVLRQLPVGHVCRILENGDLITTKNSNRQAFLQRMAPGKIKWRLPGFFNHDVVESPIDRSLWAISNELREIDGHQARFNVITQISADGKPLFRWGFYEHLDQLKALNKGYKPFTIKGDDPHRGLEGYTHVNSLFVIPDDRLAGQNPAFRAGNILISENYTTKTYILDPKQKKLIWSHSPGTGAGQHTAHLLTNGDILFFYNNLFDSPKSRVEEFSAVTGNVVWRYEGDPSNSIAASHFGSAQRLENGNTLISAAGNGALEVTPEGRTVWKWVNPALDQSTYLPIEIYRILRLPEAAVKNWIDNEFTEQRPQLRPFLCQNVWRGFCKTPNRFGLEFAKVGFTYRPSEKDSEWKVFDGDGGQMRVRIFDNMTEHSADRQAEDSTAMIESMFEQQESPYPDRISNTIQCREKPERIHDISDPAGWTKGLRLWANDRYVYGTCEQGQMTERSALIFRYCASAQQLFEIRYFVHDPERNSARAEEMNAFISTLGCKR